MGVQEKVRKASVSWSSPDKKGLRGNPDRGRCRDNTQEHEKLGVLRECPSSAGWAETGGGKGRGEKQRGPGGHRNSASSRSGGSVVVQHREGWTEASSVMALVTISSPNTHEVLATPQALS